MESSHSPELLKKCIKDSLKRYREELPSYSGNYSDTLLAVKATFYQCGPAANVIVREFSSNGINASLKSLGGHYVAMDNDSKLMYDFMCPCGVYEVDELPYESLLIEMLDSSGYEETNIILNKFANEIKIHY